MKKFLMLRLSYGKMARWKVLTLTILSLAILQLTTGCNGFKEPEKFIIGLDEEYAPFGFRNEKNELVGFDIDLAKEAARRMGVVFDFKPIDWDTKEDALDSKRIDIIWNGLDITPERKEKILFSKPYMDNRQVIFVVKGTAQDFYSEYDLEGKIVGTQAGSNSVTYIVHNHDLMLSLRGLKTYHSYINAFNALDDGEIDVLVCDELAGRYEMSRHIDKFDMPEVPVGPVTEIGIGFRKDDVELRDRVQKVFDEMIKDGTAKKISKQWFQADLVK